MTSTYTTSGVELIADGEQSGAWGATTNDNWNIVDRMLNQAGTISLSGTTHTLTLSDGILSEGHYSVLLFAGSPSGTNTVTISPNDAQRVFFAMNNSGESVVMSQGSGANVTIATGDSAIVYCDGAGSGAAVVDITANFDFISGTAGTNGNFASWDGSGLVVDSSVTIASVNALVAGTLPATVSVGTEDTTVGVVNVYGPATGSTSGGQINLYAGADHDTNNDFYTVRVSSEDFKVEDDSGTDLLAYDFSTEEWEFPKGEVTVGQPNSVAGIMRLRGQATGGTTGGELRLYTAEDWEVSVDGYRMRVASDDFIFERSVDGANIFSWDNGNSYLQFEQNVDLATGVVMTGDPGAIVDFLIDEDDMTSDTATQAPTQQSVKAYVDAAAPTIARSGLNTFSAGATITYAHGQGSEPDIIDGWLECVSATGNWSVGDRLKLPTSERNNLYNGNIHADATNIYFSMAINGQFVIMNKTSGYSFAATSTNFRVELFGVWF